MMPGVCNGRYTPVGGVNYDPVLSPYCSIDPRSIYHTPESLKLPKNYTNQFTFNPTSVPVPISPLSLGMVGTPLRNNYETLPNRIIRNGTGTLHYVHQGSPNVNPGSSFVPKTYTTSVYSPNGRILHRSGNNVAQSSQRSNTVQLQLIGQQANSVKFRPRKHIRTNIEQRNTFNDSRSNLLSQSTEGRWNVIRQTSILSGINAKEAIQILEGFVSSTCDAFRTLVGEIRNDIITGLFKSDDPDYDAAKEYYYASVTGKRHNSQEGLTQRIDYIEAIGNCKLKSRSDEADIVENHLINHVDFEYPQSHPSENRNFMGMSQEELEAFILSDYYLNIPPPSIPR